MDIKGQTKVETKTDQVASLTTTRRKFLRAGVLGSLGLAAGLPLLGRRALAAEADVHFCCTLCDHWSYTGIGWQLGIESSVLSLVDAMELYAREPHMKTCIDLDARALEILQEKFPEVIMRLKGFLVAGQLEMIACAYGQPMGTTMSGESNIRQVVLGRETVTKILGHEMATFLQEEEFTHPQVPQIIKAAGFRYGSLAQMDTWGRTGIPYFDTSIINWKGVDGTVVVATPKTWFTVGFLDTGNIMTNPLYGGVRAQAVPLLLSWEELGWENPEQPAYLNGGSEMITKLRNLAKKYRVDFVTLTEYLDQHGANPPQTHQLTMNQFGKWLTWGLGGDQVRILGRKVEGILLAAEMFDAVVARHGAKSQAEMIERAWKDLCASQSHDVGLCEYSRWQDNRFAPLERIEDTHNFTWGELGYNLLDSAQAQGQAVLDATLKNLAGRINSKSKKHGTMAATVFNPLGQERTDVVHTGRLYPLPANTKAIVVKDRAGQIVPSQAVKTDVDEQGNLTMAELAFLAAKVPSAGYDTYYLEPVTNTVSVEKSSLIIDEANFVLENEFVRVTLDPNNGAIASLVQKATGREMLDGKRGTFPRFVGRPTTKDSLHSAPPDKYDSQTSKARVDWLAKGPLFATVRAYHSWKYTNFETQVTLRAGQPYVEVASRLLAKLPPAVPNPGPLDTLEYGYWLSFATGFEIKQVLRDYPLAVEAATEKTFHALNFADFIGKDRGVLVLHPGTQWFLKEDKGVVSNLIMREWESIETGEFGWPMHSEYRHALMPHGRRELTNAARLRAADAFTRPLLCHVGAPQSGKLPPSQSFIRLTPDTLLLSAFRKTAHGTELRVLENDGKGIEATAEINLPVKGAVETNLLGKKIGEVTHQKGHLSFHVDPWKFRNFEVS